MTSARAEGAAGSTESEVVAAFDFDGTLTTGGSVWSFLVRVRGPRPVAQAAMAVLPRLVAAALFGGRAADDAKEALFRRTLGGLDASAVSEEAARFGRDHYARRRRADVGARVEQHRRHGHRLVIVSASPELYVRAVADELGFDAVIATRLEVGADGRLTGRYQGGNCRGGRKLDGLHRWTEAHAPGALVWAYGNSAGDRRLLGGADVGVDVGRLGPVGKLRAFRRLRDTAELIG
ncbi:MAG TPA: HAD-IB family hydrolase [Acidimicrobiaceae bacterium]|nr:HAD-IB family hydrolase [Acidimicrobiaceae bacterium]